VVSVLESAEVRALAFDGVSQRQIGNRWGSIAGRSQGRWRRIPRRGMCGRRRDRSWIG
jgi:hypothetical protein